VTQSHKTPGAIVRVKDEYTPFFTDAWNVPIAENLFEVVSIGAGDSLRLRSVFDNATIGCGEDAVVTVLPASKVNRMLGALKAELEHDFLRRNEEISRLRETALGERDSLHASASKRRKPRHS
jgi:hypothetical protein